MEAARIRDKYPDRIPVCASDRMPVSYINQRAVRR